MASYGFAYHLFARDLRAWMKEKGFNIQEASKATDLSRSVFYNVLASKGVNSATIAVICYWTNLDIRKYVSATEPRTAKQRGFRFTVTPEAGTTLAGNLPKRTSGL